MPDRNGGNGCPPITPERAGATAEGGERCDPITKGRCDPITSYIRSARLTGMVIGFIAGFLFALLLMWFGVISF